MFFFTLALANSFPLDWEQVSWTLPCILGRINNSVIWMVSTRSLISKTTSPNTNYLVRVPRAPIKNGCTVTSMFYSFSIPKQGSDTSLSLRFSSFYTLVCWDSNVHNFGSSFFCWLSLDLVFWSVCISKSQIILSFSFYGIDSGLRIYHLFVLSNLNFLHNSQLIIFHNQSCLI